MSDEPPEAPGIEVQIVGRNGHEGPPEPGGGVCAATTSAHLGDGRRHGRVDERGPG